MTERSSEDDLVLCLVGGDVYDGLHVLPDHEGDFLIPQSLIDSLNRAREAEDAAEQAILDHIGVGSFDGLRAWRDANP